MVTAGFLLKELAHEYNLSVVVTPARCFYLLLSFRNGIENLITKSSITVTRKNI